MQSRAGRCDADGFPGWMLSTRIDGHHFAFDKPQQYVLVEHFNVRLRNECLNETLMGSLVGAISTLEKWQEDYHSHRLHLVLGNLSLREFTAKRNIDKLIA